MKPTRLEFWATTARESALQRMGTDPDDTMPVGPAGEDPPG